MVVSINSFKPGANTQKSNPFAKYKIFLYRKSPLFSWCFEGRGMIKYRRWRIGNFNDGEMPITTCKSQKCPEANGNLTFNML